MSITSIMALLGWLIIMAMGVLCQFKNIVAGWLKFNNSLGMGKREINDKAFSLYRIVGIIWIVAGILVAGLWVWGHLAL